MDKSTLQHLAHLSREELCEEIERLIALVEMTKLINSSIEAESLYTSISHIVREHLHVERCTLFFLDERTNELRATIRESAVSEIRLPLGQGLAGSVAASGQSVIVNDAYADPRFEQSFDRASGFRTRSILCAPIRNRDGRIVGVLQLLNKPDDHFGELDLHFLESLSHHLAIAMENYMLHLDRLEKERMAGELALGREIQAQLLSPPPTDIESTEIFAESIACYEVGGDYFDFISLPDGDLGIVLGDVSGKGVPAALIMSSIQSGLRIAAPTSPDLPELLQRISRSLYQSTRGRKYVTLFLARYTPRSGAFRYVNAGHCPALIVHPKEEPRLLEATGQPIGILRSATFEEQRVILAPGDTVILYTDGYIEPSPEAEVEEFGVNEFVTLAASAAHLPLHELAALLNAEVTRFEGGVRPVDDKTLVLLRRM
jgi:phosphoserine phosphatase RsbU/P